MCRCRCIYAASNQKMKAVQKQSLLELRLERERESYVIMLPAPKGDNVLGVTLHVKEDFEYQRQDGQNFCYLNRILQSLLKIF